MYHTGTGNQVNMQHLYLYCLNHDGSMAIGAFVNPNGQETVITPTSSIPMVAAPLWIVRDSMDLGVVCAGSHLTHAPAYNNNSTTIWRISKMI